MAASKYPPRGLPHRTFHRDDEMEHQLEVLAGRVPWTHCRQPCL